MPKLKYISKKEFMADDFAKPVSLKFLALVKFSKIVKRVEKSKAIWFIEISATELKKIKANADKTLEMAKRQMDDAVALSATAKSLKAEIRSLKSDLNAAKSSYKAAENARKDVQARYDIIVKNIEEEEETEKSHSGRVGNYSGLLAGSPYKGSHRVQGGIPGSGKRR